MENLFLSAIGTEKVATIEEIKLNKQFALRLIIDLDSIFQTNYEVIDEQNCVIIRMKRSPSINWHNCYRFIVNDSGIKFSATMLGYHSVDEVRYPHIKPLGKLYDKYTEYSKADDNFKNGNHGWLEVNLPINRNSNKLKDILADIVYILEFEKYRKRF